MLEHHLKELRLPTILREYDRVARQCSVEQYQRYLLRMTELEKGPDACVRTAIATSRPSFIHDVEGYFRGSPEVRKTGGSYYLREFRVGEN
jgi:hypothetical protein